MANNRKTANRPRPVAEFPSVNGSVGVEDIPKEFQPAPEPSPEVLPPVSRSPLKKKPAPSPPDGNFFARVAAIPADDWGNRVFLYLYVLEPLCDLKQSGGKTYLNRYSAPVKDEHQIMLEYGSGRYRLMLSMTKVSAEQSNEIARFEFEIYNAQYPPKVPRAAWVNDSRNGKWEALLPKEQTQQQTTGIGTFVEVLKATNDIRREIRDEMTPAPDSAPVQQAAPVAVDPWSAAEKILNMRADNPMMAILQQQMKDNAAAQEAERQRAFTAAEAAREREFKLQQQLMEAKNSGASKGLIDQLLELAALGDKLDPLKKMLGFGNGGAEIAGRAVKTTAYDIFRDFVSSPMGQSVGQGLGMLMMNLASKAPTPGQPQPMQPRPPIVLNPQQSDGTAPQEDVEQRINRIGQAITEKMLYDFFLKDDDGAVFASHMYVWFPEDYLFMRGLGAENIIARYRQFPPAWAVIAPKEPAFIQFIQEFCAWDPNEDEAPAPTPGDDGVTDLDPEGAN